MQLCLVRCNTPPTIVAERTWSVAENTAVGSRVNQIRGSDSDNNLLQFSIGAPTLLPGLRFLDGTRFFRIDPKSGVVYLNESLSGMRGQRLMIGAVVNDGAYNAKMDIIIQITPSDGSDLNNHFNAVLPPTAGVNVIMPPVLSSSPTRPQIPIHFATIDSGKVDFSKSEIVIHYNGMYDTLGL